MKGETWKRSWMAAKSRRRPKAFAAWSESAIDIKTKGKDKKRSRIPGKEGRRREAAGTEGKIQERWGTCQGICSVSEADFGKK